MIVWLKTCSNLLLKPGDSTSIDACDEIYSVSIDYSYTMTKLITVFKMWHPNTTQNCHRTVSSCYIKQPNSIFVLCLFLVIHHYKNLDFSLIYVLLHNICPSNKISFGTPVQHSRKKKPNLNTCCCNLLLLNLSGSVNSKILCRFESTLHENDEQRPQAFAVNQIRSQMQTPELSRSPLRITHKLSLRPSSFKLSE